MTVITMEQRLARLDAAIAEDRIIHSIWHHVEKDGRELVCLLAALSPEVAEQKYAASCPADVMPLWLAKLTPPLDDCVSAEYRPELIRRYAGLAHRWNVLDADGWRRCDLLARRVALVEAMSHTDDEPTLGLCDRILGLLGCKLAGGRASDAELDSALAAEAAHEDAWAAEMAAEAADAWTDEAATEGAAERAAAWTAEAAREAAAAAAGAATAAAGAAAGAAGAAADEAAYEGAWDRMAAAILDAIEAEIERAEA